MLHSPVLDLFQDRHQGPAFFGEGIFDVLIFPVKRSSDDESIFYQLSQMFREHATADVGDEPVKLVITQGLLPKIAENAGFPLGCKDFEGSDNGAAKVVNIGRILAPMDSEVMAEFAGNLDKINALADVAPGFIWRLKDDANNATSIQVYDDNRIIVNMSVWSTIDDLYQYVYKTVHTDFLKRRRE